MTRAVAFDFLLLAAIWGSSFLFMRRRWNQSALVPRIVVGADLGAICVAVQGVSSILRGETQVWLQYGSLTDPNETFGRLCWEYPPKGIRRFLARSSPVAKAERLTELVYPVALQIVSEFHRRSLRDTC